MHTPQKAQTKGPCGKMHTRPKNFSIFRFSFFRFSFLVEYNGVLLEHNPILLEHNSVLLEHNPILLKHISILVDHNPVLLKHNSVLLERKSVLLKQNPVLLEHNAGWDRQEYGENGRIFHNLASVWSKSIKIEHGPAISLDCLDFNLK